LPKNIYKERKKKKTISIIDFRNIGKYGKFTKNDYIKRKSLLD
jgi:hypothetical protein